MCIRDRCHIDVKDGELSFDVGDDYVAFNLFKASKFPSISDACYRIDVIDNLVREEVINHVSGDPLVHCMLNNGTAKNKNPKVVMRAHLLEASLHVHLSLLS